MEVGFGSISTSHIMKPLLSNACSTASLVDLSADTALGDERIDASELRHLLDQRPDLLRILRTYLSMTK